MFDELGTPQRGEEFHQRAIIVEKKDGRRPGYVLQVSDEHGVIAGELIPELNQAFMFADNFEQQFAPDPSQTENVFLSRVRVADHNLENDQILFYRLTKDGKALEVLCREKRVKFVKTHFLPNLSPGNLPDRE